MSRVDFPPEPTCPKCNSTDNVWAYYEYNTRHFQGTIECRHCGALSTVQEALAGEIADPDTGLVVTGFGWQKYATAEMVGSRIRVYKVKDEPDPAR